MQRADIRAFLSEPMRMAQVASVSDRGTPLLGSLWFVFDAGRFWFNSHPASPLVKAARIDTEVAVIVDQFTPPDLIRQIRIRGRAEIEAHDGERVKQIYERYLGDATTRFDDWPEFFQQRAVDPDWTLWSVRPDSGVATINPDFRPIEARWSTLDQSPLSS